MSLPAGIRNYSYAEDTAVFRTRTQKWLLAIVLLALLFSPLWLSNYWLGMVSLIGITIIAATGLNMITGYAGQLSFGYAGFIAVGAYTSAILTGKYNQPFLIGLICAGLLSGIIGMLLSLPLWKIKGYYMAIITIAAQLIILWVINHWVSMTGGTAGLIVSAPSIGAWDLSSATGQYFLIVIIMVLTVFFANNLVRTRTGRAFIAVRDNERAAQAMGINLLRNKMLAFFIGCAMAGTAGALMAHWSGSINGNMFSFSESFFYIAILIIGGFGNMWGVIPGAIILRLLTNQLAPAIQGKSMQPSDVPSVVALIAVAIVAVLILILIPARGKEGWRRLKGQ